MTQALYQYQNCYGILEEIRTGLNEYSAALTQGSAVGKFDNSDIVRKICAAQRFIWHLLFVRFPELFFKSATITGTAGVYTLPSDMFKFNLLVDSQGRKIDKIPLKTTHLKYRAGSDFLYYRYGNTIVSDSGHSDALTLYYFGRVRDLTQGMSSAGGALSLTLATSARPQADYYKGLLIENITDGWSDTISAYSAARVCTLAAQTGAASKYYGMVSELPEDFHPLIGPRALLLMKDTMVSPVKSTPQEMTNFKDMFVETLRAFTGQFDDDIDLADIFYSFWPYM